MPFGTSAVVADGQALYCNGFAALLNRTWPRTAIVQENCFDGLISSLTTGDVITLAIIDLGLPGLSETAGISYLRMQFPNLRIVVTAGALQRNRVVDCLRAGVQGCIAKSMAADEIIEALETIAKGRIYVPAMISHQDEGFTPPESSSSLSERQQEVLRVLAEGKSNKEIGRHLGIAEGTVKVHVNAIFRKLQVHNRISAAAVIRDTRGNLPPVGGASASLLLRR